MTTAPHHPPTPASASQSRRRQSTIIFPSTSSSILDDSPVGSAVGSSSTLKPPASNNSHRSSFGLWGGSKSAASTPNLGNINRSTEFLATPSLPSHNSASAVPSLASSAQNADGSALDQNGLSFQQRRKRSESISGLKTTAGNISRIVRKSSSNFLRKLVKNFDDKDAPPTPSMPTSTSPTATNNNNSKARSQHAPSTSSIDVLALPGLPTMPAPIHAHGIGPLDGARSTNERHNSSPQQDLGAEPPATTSNVEPWLAHDSFKKEQNDNASPTTTASPSHSWAITADTADSSTSLSQSTSEVHTPLTSTGSTFSTPYQQRRPSQNSAISATDDGSVDEEEEESLPLAVQAISANRISRIYEAESMQQQLNQSQTSLYCSTQSMLSEEADLGSISISTNSFGNHARTSIRFSEYGIMSAKDLPLAPLSITTTLSDSAELDKPLPRRPLSMFIPVASDQDFGSHSSHSETLAPSAMEDATTNSQSTLSGSEDVFIGLLSLTVPGSSTTGVRPATICVSGEEASKLPSSNPNVTEPGQGEDLSPAAQREAMETLASQTAARCFKEDDTFMKREDISCYLGAAKPFNRLVLAFYMSHFDFSGRRLDQAFRQLCHKLILKGETQEVDRILEAFAQRFVECNPESIFGSKDVVHAIAYSILLLNTDLHVVQQSSSSKMSRSAFVKNTLQVVQAQTQYQLDPRPSEDSSGHGLTLTRTLTGENSINGSLLGSNLLGGNSPGTSANKKRTPSVKSWKSGTSFQSKSSKMGTDPKANGGHGNGRFWISELESLLKDVYSTVKHNQILLPTSSAFLQQQRYTQLHSQSPTVSILPHTGSGVHLSGMPSPSKSGGFLPRLSRQVQPTALTDAGYQIGAGGMVTNLNSVTPKIGMVRRNSINARTKQLRLDAMQRLTAQAAESQPKGHPNHRFSVAATSASSVSTNRGGVREPEHHVSHRHSTFVPTVSQIQGASAPRTPIQTSQPAQEAIIDPQSGSQVDLQPLQRMEGILFRKHLLERADKKAPHRTWRQLLVVLDQAGLSMFRADGQMGQAFEEQGILFDEIRLQHTITNILPPPGYSASRRHVFAIQLYSGAVFLFQTSTARECEDWARTCNYWAARTSKEPLPGGVINMDYGWGRSLDMLANQQQQQQQQSGLQLSHLNASGSSTSVLNSSNGSGTNLANLTSDIVDNGPIATSSAISEDDGDDRSIRTNNSVNVGSSYLNHPPAMQSPSLSATGTTTPMTSSGSMTSSPYPYGNSGVGSGRSASIKSTTSSKYGGGSSNSVPLGDRVMLFEWSPPLPTMSMVTLSEVEQCEALKRFGAGLEAEMEIHQAHRAPMTALFLPKSHNYAKAFNNWERRSRYLLKEMVKYQIYVECLECNIKETRAANEVAVLESPSLETQ